MAVMPSNLLVQVQEYQNADLAYLLNSFVFLDWSNKKFQNFQDKIGQLGDTTTFELFPYATANYGLIVSGQQTVQRYATLACTQAANSSMDFTSQEWLFNADNYENQFRRSRIMELGTAIESDVARNLVSGVTVLNPDDARYGQNINPTSGPFRFYGDGTTPINSFGQISQMIANFQDYGWAKNDLRCVLPLTIYPQIANSGLQQFAPARNDEMARTFMIGNFADCDFAKSNLLPIHTSGSVGDAASPNNILTLVSTNDASGQNITQLTLSGASGNDVNAMKAGDLLQIQDGTSGLPNMRYLSPIGHQPTGQPVQIRVLSDAAAVSGNVTINISPALVSVPGLNQNLNNSLQAGMKFKVMASHRAGILMSGNPLYLAMPKLPSYDPYPSMQTTDPDTGASIRCYWGNAFGQNQQRYVCDQIWGSTLVSDNSMRVLIPLTQ